MWSALGLVTAAAAVFALTVGPLPIGLDQLLSALGIRSDSSLRAYETAAIVDLRLPRVTLAILIGAALGSSGAAMQGLLRNPLADPGLIGVASGAALSAAAFMVIGVTAWIPERLALPLAAFAGGSAAAWLVVRLSLVDGRSRVATMLLAGLALNAIAGAGIGFLSYIADDLALRSVTYWMFGSLGKAGWAELAVAAPILALCIVLLPRAAVPLNALLLGEAEAGHLGIDVDALRRRLLTLIVVAVAVSVALAGIIGFVGLIVPHLLRLVTGPDHRLVIPGSALTGALLLLLADTASRALFVPAELPIGIFTALIGGPFFLALLLRYRNAPELS
ncbi:MAG: iron ABC transporter permease [Nevskiales bacterium]|nr:iron ABC transporter permease [Nevskiales bacterium]